MSIIFEVIGLAVCIAAGIVVAVFSLGLAIQYGWKKIALAHSLVEIQRAVKANKKTQQRPNDA